MPHVHSWHADNSSCGLTVILALGDISPAHGPTQLWPHAHSGQIVRALQHGPIPAIAGSDVHADYRAHEALKERPILRAGDALVFDARMLHRGLSNYSDEPRPVVVWQFTDVATPPPGQGVLASMTKHSYMRILGAMHSFMKRVVDDK